MSIRNLDYLFKPRSIALIGASRDAGSVGDVLARNLLRAGFDGPVMPVNPHHSSIQGVLAYPDVASLPLTPDLAVIATPAQLVPELVEQVGARGTRAAIVISAGFAELDSDEGRRLRQRVLDAARPHLLRIVGPNTVGVLAPRYALNASFAHLAPQRGHLAFVTQSGAIVTSVIDWAVPRGIGFSYLVSLGGMVDVDFGDMLDYLANDEDTRAILLHIEGIEQARKFMSAARAAARMKPVIVVKAGRHPGSAKAAASHSGALAGADDVYDAAFRRAGILRVDDLTELFAAVETLADLKSSAGRRLGILSNGGGIGVMAADALLAAGGELAELSKPCREALDAVLPATWSHGNPVDIVGDATPDRYAAALRALLDHPQDMDGLLVLNCPTAIAAPVDCAAAVTTELARTDVRIPVLTSWVGGATANAGRELLNSHGLATYDTPTEATAAFMQLYDYRLGQELLMQTPPSIPEAFSVDRDLARSVIREHLARVGTGWLEPTAVYRLLTAYGITIVETRDVSSGAEAAAAAESLGVPVALKVRSPDITHKSDVGGVMLGLENAAAVSTAAEQMLARLRREAGGARIDGFTVQPMVLRPHAHELLLGMTSDAQFGPVLVFGQGGTAVEVVHDRALGLPPLNLHLAMDMITRTEVFRRLRGYRDRPAADLDGIAMTLVRIAQLIVDLPEIRTLDINPLLADSDGVLALDARIFVSAEAPVALAIRPYPRELEATLTADDGRTFFLRPILPEDEPMLRESFAKLSTQEVRERFLVPMRTLSHITAARFTQLDFDREMALVLTEPGPPGRRDIYGVARLSADPDLERAEFAIIVRHDAAGLGLGKQLLQRLIDYARGRGLEVLWGITLRENTRMRTLARRLGFSEAPMADDSTLTRLTLEL
ncbi:MAG: bifunctional acetate--CoA ligase family protein/GNAT family N-acetyltransferase [Pseudomonadales bacterium]